MRDLGGTDILLVSSPVLYERYTELNPYLVYHPFDRGVLSCIQGDTEDYFYKEQIEKKENK